MPFLMKILIDSIVLQSGKSLPHFIGEGTEVQTSQVT